MNNINLTIVLVHNKGDIQNQAQIDIFKPFITQITDNNIQYDDKGNAVASYDTYHYELKDMPNVNVKFFQLIPFGTLNPQNLYDIDSFKVFYGKGDEDKIGDHARFFNHGMRFPIDSMSADYVYIITDHTKFSIDAIKSILNKKENKLHSHESGLIQSKESFLLSGELPEEVPMKIGLNKILGGING